MADSRAQCQPSRVLLAEDNLTNQKAAVRMLEMIGCQVDVASNGSGAVAACRQMDYGIVFMDLQMPEMDGLTASREIRTFELAEGKPPVPIIALTANAMRGDREKCLAAGMNDYLSKPFKLAHLTEMLARWAQGSLPAAPPPAPRSTAPALPDGPLDLRVLDVFRGTTASEGAPDFLAGLIDQYLAEASSTLVALRHAVERRDAHAIRDAAHSLKGTSATVGAHGMAARCEALEQRARSLTLDGALDAMTGLDEEFMRVQQALHVHRGTTP